MIENLLKNENYRILVVDDHQLVRNLLEKRLKGKGFNVATAASGREAVDFIQSAEHIDAVLLDIQMPDISGLEVLKTIREQHSKIDLPVIMISALEDNDTIVATLEQGANDYITKPVYFPIAIARIRSLLAAKYSDALIQAESSNRRQEIQFSILKSLNETMKKKITPIAADLKDISETLHDTNADIADKVNHNAKKIQALADALHKVSSNDRTPSSLEELPGRDTIKTLLERASALAGSHNIELSTINELSNDQTLWATSEPLIASLMIIVENAIDESIRSNQNKIEIKATTSDQHLKIQVIDFGEGISKENVKSIYDPFFTTKSESKFGTGLYEAKNILASLSASLEYRRQNEQTFFEVTLPIQEKKAIPEQTAINSQ